MSNKISEEEFNKVMKETEGLFDWYMPGRWGRRYYPYYDYDINGIKSNSNDEKFEILKVMCGKEVNNIEEAFDEEKKFYTEFFCRLPDEYFKECCLSCNKYVIQDILFEYMTEEQKNIYVNYYYEIQGYIDKKFLKYADTSTIEKVLLKNVTINSDILVNIIKATGRADDYLTPEIIRRGSLREDDITDLIKATGNIEKYLFEGQDANDPNLRLSIANIIKATGRVEDYLIPEEIRGMGFEDITNLIKATGNIEKYLFEGQDVNDPNLRLSIENVIKGTGQIEEYLTLENLKKYNFVFYGWKSKELTDLIKETGNIEKYLFEGQDAKDPNLRLSIANVIKGTGNIEEYLKVEYVVSYRIDAKNIIMLLKDANIDTELTEKDIKLLYSFGDEQIRNTIMSLEVQKQKDAITILDSLSRSNSAELRRVKVPIALQILERKPEEYNDVLNKIEGIYLTNNIPTVGKLYLVFQELHPKFLGEENSQREDDSYANIPSLNVADKTERKHIIFSDLLRCALESNNRNIREYLETIEQGDILYKQLLTGELELELEELNLNDKKLEILSRYRDILNTLYNVTSKGKRKENARKNSDDLAKDLKELDSLFGEDLIEMDLPDRIIRTFAHGTGIRTFEQAKSIIRNTRENTHNRNVKAVRDGKIELKQGDFVKGVVDTQYFSSMLQTGILAKDFLGGNARHDATPLDTDVEKVLEEGESFRNTLKRLTTANSFTSGDVNGKKLGTIMLVFSGDNFIETRDESRKTNEGNLELLKIQNDKKEVFYNGGSEYGIRTGIGSTNIKCIIVDRYVDKLGLEIAKNGFYIPIVDKEGNVIYTEKMYNELCEKMQGLTHYGKNEFVMDPKAKNEGTRQIAELVDKIKQNAQSKRVMILKTLQEAVEKNGYMLSEERKIDLTPGFIEFIDTGSTGRGTNEPGDGDFDFMVRMDKVLSDAPENLKKALREALRKIKQPKEEIETAYGDFRYKGVSIEGLDKEVDIDLTFTERTNEIEYSTDECIRERLNTIRSQSLEDYRYVVANVLLAKKLLKQAKSYKKANAPEPEEGQSDTRGGLGAVGIENWVLQNGGSFYKAAESFLQAANESKDLEEFRSKYSVWDFGENHISTAKDIYAHDNFVYNMNEDGYKRMKEALEKYIEAVKNENSKQEEKNGLADIIAQDTSVIEDTPYILAVKSIMAKGNELEKEN